MIKLQRKQHKKKTKEKGKIMQVPRKQNYLKKQRPEGGGTAGGSDDLKFACHGNL